MAHRLTRTEKLLALAHIPIRQPALSELPHKQRVLRLYRRLLKEYLNWAGNRKIWYHGAGIIKTLFKNNMHETDPARVKKLVEEAEHVLVTFAHPAPYIIPYAPGGTLYQRNTPVPFELTQDEALVDFDLENSIEYESEYSPPTVLSEK